MAQALHKEGSKEGLAGPSKRGTLLKRSEHVKEWRERFFELRDRKLYYYENADDANPNHSEGGEGGEQSMVEQMQARRAFLDGEGGEAGGVESDLEATTFPKGFFYTTGASVEPFEEEDDEAGMFYGFLISEEVGEGDAPAARMRLCTEDKRDRDEWCRVLMLARRPAWVPDKDAQASTCMVTGGNFSPMPKKRRHHCRRCGCVMLRDASLSKELHEIGYAKPVRVCTACEQGAAASRWITKIPKSARGRKKKNELHAAADAAAEAGRKAKNFVGSMFGGGSPKK